MFSNFWIIVHYDKNLPFNTFFQDIAMTKQDYIASLSTSIYQPYISLKRHPTNSWINPFAKGAPKLWLESTYVQYILNSFATTSYYSSYMTKFD